MNRIEETIRRAIEEHRMLENCDRVIVGFSGGADSTALLHYLQSHFNGELIAAHVNHHLRGEESLRDEDFVRAFCKERSIPLVVKQAEIAALAKEQGRSVEECGRQVRYDFFHSLLRSPDDRIAVAHTLSDSGETMLFHLARGTGIRGLQGIPPVRDPIVRPLIGLTREDVERYCDYYGLPFVEDSTNSCDEYARNRIRHHVMPALREINPRALQAMGRTARQLREQEEAVSFLAQRLRKEAAAPDGCRLDVLRQYPKAAVLQFLLEELRGKNCSSVTDQKLRDIYDAVLSGKGGVTVNGEIAVRVERGLLLFLSGEKQEDPLREIPFAPPQSFSKNGKRVEIQVIPAEKCKNNKNNCKFLFDNLLEYDTIQFGDVWRSRRDGDRIRLSGRGVTKPLKKLFQEKDVPPALRDRTLVLARGDQLLWAEGFGPAEGFAVTDDTKTVLRILITEETGR